MRISTWMSGWVGGWVGGTYYCEVSLGGVDFVEVNQGIEVDEVG